MPGQTTNFIYVLFGGNEIYFSEAAYSIGRLRRQMNPQTSRIMVFTDSPEKIRTWPVTVVPIADQIGEMKGQSAYGFRVKLCCIIQCLETCPGAVVYLDSDTIMKRPVDQLCARLNDGCAVMYRRAALNVQKSPFKNLHIRLPGGGDYRYGPESRMFNAGVIGLRPADVEIVRNARVICDAYLLQGGKSHIGEQLAISEALRISGRKILGTHDLITHYYRGSAKRYMRHQIAAFARQQGREPWELEPPIPYSYLRIQWFKLFGKAAPEV